MSTLILAQSISVPLDTSLIFTSSPPTVMRGNTVIARETPDFLGFAAQCALAILEGGIATPTVLVVDGGLALLPRLIESSVDQSALINRISWEEEALLTWGNARYPQFNSTANNPFGSVSGGALLAASTYGPFDYIVLMDPGLTLTDSDFAQYANEFVYSMQAGTIPGTA